MNSIQRNATGKHKDKNHLVERNSTHYCRLHKILKGNWLMTTRLLTADFSTVDYRLSTLDYHRNAFMTYLRSHQRSKGASK